MGEMFDSFQCLTCEDNSEFENRTDAIKHIIEKHGYVKGTPARKDLRMHLDFQGGWESDYEWDFGTFKLYERVGKNAGTAKSLRD